MNDLESNERTLIKKTIQKENEAMLHADLKVLKDLIASNAVMEHITGAKQSRDEWLHQISLGRMKYYSSQEKSLTVVLRDASHATADLKTVLDARVYGFRNKWRLESTSNLIKKNNRWLVIFSKAQMY